MDRRISGEEERRRRGEERRRRGGEEEEGGGQDILLNRRTCMAPSNWMISFEPQLSCVAVTLVHIYTLTHTSGHAPIYTHMHIPTQSTHTQKHSTHTHHAHNKLSNLFVEHFWAGFQFLLSERCSWGGLSETSLVALALVQS